MRLHRFILDVDLTADQITITDREMTNQIRNVLRLDVGERFVICDGKGNEATVQIRLSEREVVADVLDWRVVMTESSVKTILYCAILKRENFELVVQKATECGVSAIVPVTTARTVKLGLKLDRLQKIAREAAEQSGRGIVPDVTEPMSLKEAMTHAKKNELNILFEPGSEGRSTAPNLRPSEPSNPSDPPVGLFIGPEGGWTDEEVEQMRVAGYHVASLGPRILRAETAAIVAVYQSSIS